MSLFSRLRSEEGSTLAAVLMVMMVVMAIGATSMQISQHSNDSTSVDRERLQTVQAAEAGVHDAIRRIESGAGCDAVASPFADLHDGGKLVGRYRTRIDPAPGLTVAECLDEPRRVIHAWGYAPTGGNRALRHLEVSVELIPDKGFAFTMFAEGSDGSIYVKNTGTITGDAYAEFIDQSKNNLNGHNVITRGSLTTLNDAIYTGSLWAGGNIHVAENGRVARSITATGTAPASQGNILLDNNVQVGGDVLAKGDVNDSANGVIVNGSVSENNPNLPAPPVLTKPTYDWNPANYLPIVPTTGNAAQITTALNTARNNLQGVFYSSDASGTVALPNNVRVTGPLTIVSSGKVDLGRSMNITGGPFQVTVIAQSTAADAIDFASTFTSAPGLHVLLYTMGGVDGRNLMNFTGAIYGNSIDVKNSFYIDSSDWLRNNPPPGFTWDQYSAAKFTAVPTLWREVAPGDPPA